MSEGVGQKLTCDRVRALVEEAGYEWAIVIAGLPGTTQFTTWGKAPENKVHASAMANYIGDELCGPPKEVFESFSLEAAQNKAALEQLQDECEKIAQGLLQDDSKTVQCSDLPPECALQLVQARIRAVVAMSRPSR